MKSNISAALFAATAFLCVNPACADELSASQVRGELVGASIIWHATDGILGGELFLHDNGTAELVVSVPWRAEDHGRWHLSGDLLCTEWETLRNSENKCYTVRKVDTGRFETSGGNIFVVATAGV